jgi:hypothetical protein
MQPQPKSFRKTVEDLYRVPVQLTPLAISDFTRAVHRDGSIHIPYNVKVAETGRTYQTDDDDNPEHATVCVDLYDWQFNHRAGTGNVLANFIAIMRTRIDAEVAGILWCARAKRSDWKDTFHLEIVPQTPVCGAPLIHFETGKSHFSWQGLFHYNPEQLAIVRAAQASD